MAIDSQPMIQVIETTQSILIISCIGMHKQQSKPNSQPLKVTRAHRHKDHYSKQTAVKMCTVSYIIYSDCHEEKIVTVLCLNLKQRGDTRNEGYDYAQCRELEIFNEEVDRYDRLRHNCPLASSL